MRRRCPFSTRTASPPRAGISCFVTRVQASTPRYARTLLLRQYSYNVLDICTADRVSCNRRPMSSLSSTSSSTSGRSAISMASTVPIASLFGAIAICVKFMAITARYALTSFTWGRLLDSKIRVSHTDLSPLLLQAEQRGVAAGGGGVDRERALGGEAVEIARAAGLG